MEMLIDESRMFVPIDDSAHYLTTKQIADLGEVKRGYHDRIVYGALYANGEFVIRTAFNRKEMAEQTTPDAQIFIAEFADHKGAVRLHETVVHGKYADLTS